MPYTLSDGTAPRTLHEGEMPLEDFIRWIEEDGLDGIRHLPIVKAQFELYQRLPFRHDYVVLFCPVSIS